MEKSYREMLRPSKGTNVILPWPQRKDLTISIRATAVVQPIQLQCYIVHKSEYSTRNTHVSSTFDIPTHFNKAQHKANSH